MPPTDELLADERLAFALRHPRKPTTAKQERRCHFDQREQHARTPGSARGAGAEEAFDIPHELVVLDLELDAEAELVRSWRLEELERAGYAADQASELADRMYVDLHRATDLLRNGCSPELAFRILV